MPDTTPEEEEHNFEKTTRVQPGVKPPGAQDSEASGATKRLSALDATGQNGETTDESTASDRGSSHQSKRQSAGKTAGDDVSISRKTGTGPGKNNIDYTGAVLSNRYEVLRLVGEGGMGSLYAGQHVDIGRKVAIKLLHRDFQCSEEVFLRFREEAKMAATLTHHNICHVYDFGRTDDGTPYLIMDLLEGKTLSEVLETEKRLSPRRAVRIIAHICEALTHAHGKGVVHRDMKPSNIMVEGEGTSELSKLVDFGIAKNLQSDALKLTAQHETIGSPYYMSPEQCQALPLDHRTDIYSLGCVLYECVTGRIPFKATSALQTMYSHVHTEPESFSSVVSEVEIPSALEEVVFKAMKKDPNDRFQTAEEFKMAAFRAVGAMSHDCLMSEYLGAPTVKTGAISAAKSSGTNAVGKSLPKWLVPALGLVALLGLGGYGLSHQEDIALIMEGRTPGEIYNGDDSYPERWDFPVMTTPAVYAIYLGQAHDTPRSKDNDLTIMGHAKVRVTPKTPDINLVLLSHAQVEWNVETAPGTKVENYIVSSTYGKSQVKGVPEDRIKRIDMSGFSPIGYSNLNDYSTFPELNQKIAKALGKDLPSGGTIIHSMQGAQQLKEFEVSERLNRADAAR
jgi:serine/threonine protein kinase